VTARLALVLGLAVVPAVLPGQEERPAADSVESEASQQPAPEHPWPLHATLRGWADGIWLRVLNRSGSTGGRLSDLGILQRFHPITDFHYKIDLISNKFTLSEDYVWWRKDRGFRWATGSVTTRDLAQWMEFKIRVPVTGGWNVNLHYNFTSTVEAQRNVLRVAFGHEWKSGWFTYLGSTLIQNKADIDMMVGGGWRSRGARPAEFSVVLAALDPFNDHLFVGLGVNPGVADTAVSYQQQGYAAQATVEIPIGSRVRFEAHGAITNPATFSAFVQGTPDSGFTQTDRARYAAGLLEWSAARWVSVGAMGNYVFAEIDRRALSGGIPSDNFTRQETEASLGGFGLLRLGRAWEIQTWLAHNWRPETKRVFPEDSLAVDYEDRAWGGMALLVYGKPTGFTAMAGLVADFREVLRGDGQLPTLGSLDRDNARFRLDLGWRLEDRGYLYIGAAFDLDNPSSLFDRGVPDGYRARLVIDF
jgi:hypothetical protein